MNVNAHCTYTSTPHETRNAKGDHAFAVLANTATDILPNSRPVGSIRAFKTHRVMLEGCVEAEQRRPHPIDLKFVEHVAVGREPLLQRAVGIV